MLVEPIVATALGGAVAGFLSKVWLDRWKTADRFDARYVNKDFCDQCQRLGEERYTALTSRFDAFEQANRDDHGRIMSRIDQAIDLIRRSNGHRGGGD